MKVLAFARVLSPDKTSKIEIKAYYTGGKDDEESQIGECVVEIPSL